MRDRGTMHGTVLRSSRSISTEYGARPTLANDLGMRVVLIPGWNEGADQMRVFADGRHGKPGLTARGFECSVFDGGSGSLRDRIDQCKQFIAGLRAAAGAADERVALFGYSAGGLVARGVVRAYPDAP